MALAVWANAQILSQLVSGYRWYGSVITYGFPGSALGLYNSDSGDAAGFQAVDPAQQAIIKLALGLWDDLIAVSLQQTTSFNSNVEFAYTSTTSDYAYAYQPDDGSVWLSSKYASGSNNLVSPTIGQHGFLAIMHEIGHALGLDHMGNYEGSSPLPSCYQDSTVYSIMSYFGPTGPEYSSNIANADWQDSRGYEYEPQTPMLSDILAIQSIYGASTTTRSGDTTYGFHSTITDASASIYDFTKNLHPILTLYDSGGNDTLDLSGWSSATTIDLTPGNFSSCNGMTYNIAIAPNCLIENVVGGSGNDTLAGNTANNLFDGGSGRDTAVMGDTLAHCTIRRTGSDYSVSGSNTGSDTLRNIESIRFVDMTVNLTIKASAATLSAANLKLLEELYVAFFNRVPEADGLEYWIGQFGAGRSVKQIADSFYNAGVQASSLTGYTSTMSNADFVNVIYRNVLGRSGGADAEGLAYWSGALASGKETRGSLVTTILASAHSFKGNATWGWVADLLDNKASVADQFAVQHGLGYLTSDAAISHGMAIAQAVTATDTQGALSLIGVPLAQIGI